MEGNFNWCLHHTDLHGQVHDYVNYWPKICHRRCTSNGLWHCLLSWWLAIQWQVGDTSGPSSSYPVCLPRWFVAIVVALFTFSFTVSGGAWSNWVDRTSWDCVLITVTSSSLGSDMDCDVLCWWLGIYSCTFIHNISVKSSTIMHIPLAHLLYCLLDVMPLHTHSVHSSIASMILLPFRSAWSQRHCSSHFRCQGLQIFCQRENEMMC